MMSPSKVAISIGAMHTVSGVVEIGETHVERRCDNCEHPTSSLLRVVLIGEIIRADEADLYVLAELFDELGLLELSDEEESPSDDPPSKRNLHRIK